MTNRECYAACEWLNALRNYQEANAKLVKATTDLESAIDKTPMLREMRVLQIPGEKVTVYLCEVGGMWHASYGVEPND